MPVHGGVVVAVVDDVDVDLTTLADLERRTRDGAAARPAVSVGK
jgi:hypothetical protein